MQRRQQIGDLTPPEWDRLQELLDCFEEAWSQSESVDLALYLPRPGDRLRPLALQELVKSELEIRWRRGQNKGLEEYLALFPELEGVPEALPTLLYEEYRVRQLHGDRPHLSAYLPRFPAHFTKLQRLVREQPLEAPPPAPTTPTPARAPSPAPGAGASSMLRVIGGYRLIKRIGAGTFGEVWRAEAPGGVEVAIKIIFRPIDHQEAQRELDSLELIKKLTHPFLLQVHAFWSLDHQLVIAMELAEGSLRDRLKQCRRKGEQSIPTGELLTYFREAAEALDYLHSKQVQHRDVKPDNILLLQRHAKVADFGMARMMEARRSMTATVGGTPAYMPPEMWRGRVSEHSDQYSLAVSYAEMRLGRRLFPSKELMQLMLDHVDGTPDLHPLEESERRVLLKALAKQADQRYGSCQEFAQALEEVLAPGMRKTAEFVPQEPPTPAKQPTSNLTPAPDISTDPFKTLPPAEKTTAPSPPLSVEPKKETGPARPQPQPRPRPRWLIPMVLVMATLLTLAVVFRDQVHDWLFPQIPEVDYLPKGCQKAEGAEVVQVGDKKLYSRVAYALPDGARIVFILIPKDQTTDPDPFYIMENKVSVGEFRQFADANPDKVGPVPMGGDPQRPVTKITLPEAHAFAEWLGGRLPRVGQWDQAARKGEGGRGPNMAGNGEEWTRSLMSRKPNKLDAEYPVPEPEDYQALLRGESKPGAADLTQGDEDRSFRVVLELVVR